MCYIIYNLERLDTHMEPELMSKDTLLSELYAQTSPEFMKKIGEIVTERLLKRIPNYYQGGAKGLFERYCNRLGGYANVYFRLGRAGFNPEFYLTYTHYDSELELLKLRDKDLSPYYLLTDQDIDQIVNHFVVSVNYYLGEQPKTKADVDKEPHLTIRLVKPAHIITSKSLGII